VADYLVLRAVRESDGTAVAVSDVELMQARLTLAQTTGIFASPEGAAAYAALPHLRDSGFLTGDERVVVFNTGTGLKY
jgi:threonine synthase